jgi:cytidyltransferase-like protein
MKNKTIVVCSGYYNPVHSGHINYLESAKSLGDHLIVIINSDHQVNLKGSKPFMDESERMHIITALRCVDGAVVAYDKDSGVSSTIGFVFDVYSNKYETLDFIFANGGDRNPNNKNSKEDKICKKYGIKQVFNVGGHKTQSSSKLLENI